jgi:HEAT repeat protein
MKFEELIDIFQNDALPEKRRQAVEDITSGDMFNEISIKAFANGLLDSDVGVRDICLRSLLDTPENLKRFTALAVVPFINMREIELRNLAGEILTKLGDASVQVLLPYLKSSDFDVRKFACDILGLIGNENITTYITPLLSDSDKNVQLSAVEALGNLHAQNALDQLIMVYENFDEIKSFVIEAIGKIGGENSESYLLEQLDNEKDQFLQITIIDALAFNAKDIGISYKLLSKMANSNLEMQKIMLMTAFAISFRLSEQLLMPDELRYISHSAMYEEDPNIMIASLISLGDSYRIEDVKPLIHVVSKEIFDLNQQIMHNIAVNSLPNVIAYFFEELFNFQDHLDEQSEFIDNISLFWSEIPEKNKETIMESLLTSFEFTSSQKILNLFSLLQSQDKSRIDTMLRNYSLETSQENRELISTLFD